MTDVGDLSEERTPTMGTIPPPPLETPEYTPPRSPSPSPENLAANDESRLQKALGSVSTIVPQASMNTTIDQTPLQELSPPPSPPTQSPPHHPQSSPRSFLSTPPRRPLSHASKLEFQTPSPPKNLPELPGPPPSSSEDETGNETGRTPLRSDLTVMKTPRPPGAWDSTHAYPEQNDERSSSSLGDISVEQGNSRSRTPIRALRSDLTSTKTPRPPGAWATPVPSSSREPPTRTRSLSGDTDEECDSGLATPIASLSRASSLPAQTPRPPGAWTATPAARKSILKVRFDTQSDSPNGNPTTGSSRNPLENITNASTRTDDVSVSTESSLGPHRDEVLSRGRMPEVSSPATPASRRLQSPSRKSPGIRILDAFGREVVKDESQPRPSSPKSKGGIRIVDAMGREVGASDERSLDVTDNPEEPLMHAEAVVRVRQRVADLAEDLDAMARTNEDAWIDFARLQELRKVSEVARAARMEIGQAISSNDADLQSKLGPLRRSMRKSGLFMSSAADRRWPSSWVFWAAVVGQLLLICIMYRLTITRARDLFLTTYYDPFYPGLHLYTSRPDPLRLSMHSSSGASWFSIPHTLHREGWKASSRKIWENFSIVVWDCQQLLWKTLGDGATESSSWPPT
ncbi:hypothetical protein FPV67DRAFT_1012205 [Lyophyllum atratum]|nr:hypothetical protein FPV67DRAFT_1012205 [Lyophyllum atratum]